MAGAFGGTCSADLWSAVVSIDVGLIGTGPAAACSLVVIPAASCSGISVNDELQFDNSMVDDAY
jgi:hypothetical protein